MKIAQNDYLLICEDCKCTMLNENVASTNPNCCDNCKVPPVWPVCGKCGSFDSDEYYISNMGEYCFLCWHTGHFE